MTENKLNRTELIRAVATRTGFTIKDTTEFMEALEDTVSDALRNGQKVAVLGGKMYVTQTAARTGVKPGTSDPIEIPAKFHARFKAGKPLQDILN